MKKFFLPFFLLFVFAFALNLNPLLADSAFLQRLKGRILLQVEENGEAWYVNPDDMRRYYLRRPKDAFNIMRKHGLGISENDFDSFGFQAPKKLSGKIILRVEASGEAYYINPDDLRMYYLAKPEDAFRIMNELGLGVTNKDLYNIPHEEIKESYIQENSASKWLSSGSQYWYSKINRCERDAYKCEEDVCCKSCITFRGSECIDEIDIKSFKRLGYQYGRDKNVVFHWGHKKWNIDKDTFEVVNNYAGDKNNIFWYGEVVEGTDLRTFEVLNGYAAKDNKFIYCEGKKREDFDYNSLEVINFEYIKDKNGVYFECRKIGLDPATTESLSYYCAKDKNKIYCRHREINNIDIFSLIKINDKYLKDKNNVFLIEREGFIKIKEADPDSFEIIDDFFARDKNNIFEDQKKIAGLNPDSFEVIKPYKYGTKYLKDEKGVYDIKYNGASLIKGADQKTFEIININYNKDKNNIYYQDKILENADVDSFDAFGDYAKDNEHLFYFDKIVSEADLATLQELKNIGPTGGAYIKDANNVYCKGDIIEGADPDSFQMTTRTNKYSWVVREHLDAKDKNGYYLNCKLFKQ